MSQLVLAVDRKVTRGLATAFRASLPSRVSVTRNRRCRRSFLSVRFVEEGAFAMQQHVIKANIDHSKKLLESETDPPTRAMLLCFLAEEVAKHQEYLVRHARPLAGIVQ